MAEDEEKGFDIVMSAADEASDLDNQNVKAIPFRKFRVLDEKG